MMNKFFEFTDRFFDKHIHNAKLNSALKKIFNLEMFYYLFFGLLATLVSISTYFLFKKLLGEKYTLIANIISWIITVTFAFITNKFIVFKSKSTESETLIKEIISFTAARLLSLGVEEAGLAIAQFVFHSDKVLLFTVNLAAGQTYRFTGTDLAKLILQIIVVIMNYVLSKLFIFKDKSKDKTDEEK